MDCCRAGGAQERGNLDVARGSRGGDHPRWDLRRGVSRGPDRRNGQGRHPDQHRSEPGPEPRCRPHRLPLSSACPPRRGSVRSSRRLRGHRCSAALDAQALPGDRDRRCAQADRVLSAGPCSWTRSPLLTCGPSVLYFRTPVHERPTPAGAPHPARQREGGLCVPPPVWCPGRPLVGAMASVCAFPHPPAQAWIQSWLSKIPHCGLTWKLPIRCDTK